MISSTYFSNKVRTIFEVVHIIRFVIGPRISMRWQTEPVCSIILVSLACLLFLVYEFTELSMFLVEKGFFSYSIALKCKLLILPDVQRSISCSEVPKWIKSKIFWFYFWLNSRMGGWRCKSVIRVFVQCAQGPEFKLRGGERGELTA